MSGNGQDHQIPEGLENQDNGQEEEDDDFGEFEGFEGGVERMQAQPAPSPWATFPDLLPVQTSPATPAEDGQASTSRAPAPREPWQPAGPSHEPQRTLNPPDVSLGTNQAAGGRVTPDNVHDAAMAVVMNHLDNGLDARLPVAQIDRLNQQLEHAEQDRSQLEQQINGLRQRNNELEVQLAQQMVSNQALTNELRGMIQRNAEILEQGLNEIKESSALDMRQDLRQIQEEIASMKQSQIEERNQLEASRLHVEEIKAGISNRLQVLESNLQTEYTEMEKRLSKKFEDQCQQIKEAIDTVVQQTAQQVAGNLSQVVCNAVQSSGGGEGQSNLLQSIQIELEKHKDHQKRALMEERQRQLMAISSALQSALQHLNSAINKDSKPNDENSS